MSLKDEKIDLEIDARGQICPYPLISFRDGYKKLENGKMLKIIVDHKPAAKQTMPDLFKKYNIEHEIVENDGEWEIYVKKKDPLP